MDTITIDGVDEHEFRHSIEDMLRCGDVDQAIGRLRVLLEPHAGPGGRLPSRFLEIDSADVTVGGWDRLPSRLLHHDRPNFPISAIGIALADARVLGGPGPQNGRLAPFLKTFYFTDDAYPFTEASRDDLLDGYSREGFGWQGDYQATDATLSIRGIDDLHGAIIALEDRLLDQPAPDMEEIRAGTIGACFVAALIHRALRDAIRAHGMPRPLCVIAACDGVYPFFDAPVAGWDDCVPEAAAEAEAEEVWPNELEDDMSANQIFAGEPAGEASLLDMAAPRSVKQMALAIGEEELAEAARFTADASARRMEAEHAVAPKRSAENNAPGGGLGLLDLVERRPEPAPAPFRPGPVGPVQGSSIMAAFAPGPADRDAPADDAQETGSAADERADPLELDPGEETAAPAPASDPSAFPSGRSLRWRFESTHAEPVEAPVSRIGAAVAAVRQAFVRLRAKLGRTKQLGGW